MRFAGLILANGVRLLLPTCSGVLAYATGQSSVRLLISSAVGTPVSSSRLLHCLHPILYANGGGSCLPSTTDCVHSALLSLSAGSLAITRCRRLMHDLIFVGTFTRDATEAGTSGRPSSLLSAVTGRLIVRDLLSIELGAKFFALGGFGG